MCVIFLYISLQKLSVQINKFKTNKNNNKYGQSQIIDINKQDSTIVY